MRTPGDAERSLKKYVAEALAPNPVLAALRFQGGPTVWTTHGMVKGAVDLAPDAWAWLRTQSRYAAVEVGSPDTPLAYYAMSDLVDDPAAAAAAAGVDLTGPVVAEYALPNQPRWEVRLWYDRGEIPADRPHARVERVGANTAAGPAMWTDHTQPFSIECYPMPGDTVDESKARAAAVEAVLLRAFKGAGYGLGRPRRVPLWDFDGVPVTETSSVRNASDYMRVVDCSTRELPDPQEPRRIAVIADVRLSWDRTIDLGELSDRSGNPVRGARLVEVVDLTTEVS